MNFSCHPPAFRCPTPLKLAKLGCGGAEIAACGAVCEGVSFGGVAFRHTLFKSRSNKYVMIPRLYGWCWLAVRENHADGIFTRPGEYVPIECLEHLKEIDDD
jgi:hypothetical protein